MKKLYKRHAIYKNKKGNYNVVTIRTSEPEILEAYETMYETLRKKKRSSLYIHYQQVVIGNE